MPKRQIQDLAAALLMTIGAAGLLGAEGTDAKATALVARLKQALGGESKLASLQGFSIEADMRRVLPGEGAQAGPEMSGAITIDIGGPSKYLFVDSFSPMPGIPPISIGSGIDGDTQWMAPLSAPSGPVMIRTPTGDPGRLRSRLERDLSRIKVALLAGSGLSGVEFTYGGVAESPDGKAEVLNVKAPGNFEARLFLDEKTSRPLMLVYQEAARRIAMRRESPGSTTPAGHGGMSAGTGAEEAGAVPEMKEAQMFLADYRTEDGISWPHTITVRVQDGQTEEWTVRKVKANPKFDADHFKKR